MDSTYYVCSEACLRQPHVSHAALTELIERRSHALCTELDCYALVLFGAREAGCFREVAAKHSDHLRQAPSHTVPFSACIP